MADVNLEVGLKVEQSSLRRLQQELGRVVGELTLPPRGADAAAEGRIAVAIGKAIKASLIEVGLRQEINVSLGTIRNLEQETAEINKRVLKTLEKRAALEKKSVDSVEDRIARRDAEENALAAQILKELDAREKLQKQRNRQLAEEISRERAASAKLIAAQREQEDKGIRERVVAELASREKRLSDFAKKDLEIHQRVTAELGRRAEILGRQNSARSGELNEALKAFGITQEANRLGQSINDVLRRRVNQFRSSSGGGGQAGNTVTFRGAGDIQRFASSLSPDQLDGFIKALRGTSDAANLTGRSLKTFLADMRKGESAVESLRNRFTGANQAAFDFGVRISQTARRFLEWATPATFIFSTISRLRQATDEVIELDRAARRLAFFEKAGLPIDNTNRDIKSFSTLINQSADNLQAFFNISSRTGIAMKDVAEALLTTARIGVNLDNVIKSANSSTGELTRGFASTVLQMVNLEAGAISAEKATTRLRAIQAQLIDTLGLTDQQAQLAAANIGDLLVSAAARTSFSVDELSNAVARLGTSFNQIQGTSIPGIIETIATAAKITGAEVGRLATTFRQLTTQVVRNAERLRQGFNIQIIDPKTNQATFEGILSFLREVNRLSKASSQQSRLLASLGTDQRNVNEVKQLAIGVAALEKEFGNLSSTQSQVAIAGTAARNAFLGNAAIADSLRGKLNALDAEFAKLTATFLSSSAFTGAIDGLRGIVGGVTSLIQNIKQAEPAFNALLAFLTAKFLPKILSAFVGLGAGLKDTFTGVSSKAEIKGLLKSSETGLQAVNRAQNEGFLTAQQANKFRQEAAAAEQRILVTANRLSSIENKIAIEKARQIPDSAKILRLEEQRATAQLKTNAAIARENLLRANTVALLDKQRQSLLQNNTALATAGALGGLLFTAIGSEIATTLRDKGERAAAAGVEKGVTFGILGGIAGAALGAKGGALAGSIGGPLGTAIGGLVGGGIALAIGRSRGIKQETERINKEKEIVDKANRVADEARATQLAVIEAQEKRIAEFSKDRLKEETRVLNLQSEIQRQQLQKEGTSEAEQIAQIVRLGELQKQLVEATTKLEKQKLDIQARQILFASRLNDIRRQEQEILAQTDLTIARITTNVAEEISVPLRIVFERNKIAAQITSIAEQIQVELEKQKTVELRIDQRAFVESEQRVADLRSQARQLEFRQAIEEIQLRKQLQDRQANLFTEQLNKLEGANEEFARSIEGLFQAQSRIADTIIQAGDLASRTLAERGKDFLEAIGASGQEVGVRLNILLSQTNRELAQVSLNRQAAEESLRQTGVSAFTGLDDINSALGDVSDALNTFAKRATGKIFEQVTGQFDKDLFFAQERAKIAKQEFTLRLQQTRQELALRQNIAQQEIGILQERLRAERQLRDLRVEQQREFGRLLLQGPEEFNKVIQQFTLAKDFFKGLGKVDLESLRNIERRIVTLRNTGQFETLRAIQSGLQNAVRTGAPRVLGGVSNEEALRIVEQLATSGLPGGTKAEDVFFQLQRQQEDQGRQLAVQKEISRRQEELRQIALQQIQLQKAEAGLNAASLQSAALQRNALITSAARRLNELEEIRRILDRFITTGIKLQGGVTPPIPVSAANTGISSGALVEQASIAAVNAVTKLPLGAIAKETLRAAPTSTPEAGSTRREQLQGRLQAIHEEAANERLRLQSEREKVEAEGLANFLKLDKRIGSLRAALKETIQGRGPTPAGKGLAFSFKETPGFAGQGFSPAAQAIFKELSALSKQRDEVLINERKRLKELSAEAIQEAQQAILSKYKAEIDAINKELFGQLKTAPRIREQFKGLSELEISDFGLLPPNLQPRGAPLRQVVRGRTPGQPGSLVDLPGLKRTDEFARALSDFTRNIQLTSSGGFRFSRQEEQNVIQRAIEAQGGRATTPQRRELERLKRQDRDLGRVFAPGRGARALLEDPLRRRGIESGFTELLSGKTPFIQTLRNLTDLEKGGTLVSGRRQRELDVRKFQDLLKDVGLGGVAGGITSQDQAARLATQILRLSESLEKSGGRFGKAETETLLKLLAEELKATLNQNSKSFLEKLGQIAPQREGEAFKEAQARQERERAELFKQAAQDAITNINQAVFKEVTSAVGQQLVEQLGQAEIERGRQVADAIKSLQDLKVSFQDAVKVQLEANLKQTVQVDQQFVAALEKIFPNISKPQLQALIENIAVLIKIERPRGTAFPPSADALTGGPGSK
jgi:hypothetical protein